MNGLKFATISLCLFLAAVCAYVIAIAFFFIQMLGDADQGDEFILVVPYSIQIGIYSNAAGALVALVGFFRKAEKKWPCGIALAMNVVPPIVAWGIIAVVFIMLE